MAVAREIVEQKQQVPPLAQKLPGNSGLVFRKCDCGGVSGLAGDCPECKEKQLSLKPDITRPRDRIQLKADSGKAGAAPSTGLAQSATSAQLIVDDDSREVAPGQMRKTQFLDELRIAVCATADAELAAAGRSTQGCPYIEKWIGHYRTKDSRYAERSLHKFAPEAAGITSARDYIPIVSNRIRRSVQVWAKTGQITGVPEELAGEIPGGGLLGGLGGLASGVAGAIGGLVSGIGSAISSVTSGIGKAFSSIGSLFFKGREGEAGDADPQQIQADLGSGQPLDTSVKSRMEPAFGHDFSRVRVHNDSGAAQTSANLNARAFTLGEHVAFGPGEYRPGTIVGDALIAHELAHVVQQGERRSLSAPAEKGDGEYSSLEEEADNSAVRAVASIWTGVKSDVLSIGAGALPRLRSGLRLSRCGPPAPDKMLTPKEATKEMVSMPELRDELKNIWRLSVQDPMDLYEYSLTVVVDAATGKYKRVHRERAPAKLGQTAEVTVCLPPDGPESLQPGERVLGTIHTHPIPYSETPESPDLVDMGTVCKQFANHDIARCGTQHYVIGKEYVYKFDCSGFLGVGKRKEIIGE